ncbi:MAG TPA: Fis family transcriptional regulator [Acidobacteria bacterium]|nr:Fis family transcriptional regulator [Acidobacteriota bacterium]
MAAEIFTDDWARAWCEQINANEEYAKAAKRWEGAIVLLMAADEDYGIPEQRAVIADLWHGECRGGKVAGESDLEEAPYIIGADPAIWSKILSGDLDPIVGLVGGKLKLERGKLFKLLPYAKAAKEMVESAKAVDTSFPPEWK